MASSLYEHTDYKRYLLGRLPVKGAERGARQRLAQHLNCQPAYISQVLNGDAHFSLEHGALIDDFLEHTAKESRYFMLLVHLGRAGSARLRNHYLQQVEAIRADRQQVSERVQAESSISTERSYRYYSAWHYSAIHILLMIPRLREKRAIADFLKLPLAVVSEALEFLVEAGLANEQKGKYSPVVSRLHLGSQSDMIQKHHLNWRVRSMVAIDTKDPLGLHYSGPIAVSRENAEKLRTVLLQAIERMEPILAEPGEEEGYGVGIDFFRL